MTAEEVLAALDFAPSMLCVCGTREAVAVARTACGCWTWLLCDDCDEWLRRPRYVPAVGYCRNCHRTSPMTLEALSAPGDGQTPPPHRGRPCKRGRSQPNS